MASKYLDFSGCSPPNSHPHPFRMFPSMIFRLSLLPGPMYPFPWKVMVFHIYPLQESLTDSNSKCLLTKMSKKAWNPCFGSNHWDASIFIRATFFRKVNPGTDQKKFRGPILGGWQILLLTSLPFWGDRPPKHQLLWSLPCRAE